MIPIDLKFRVIRNPRGIQAAGTQMPLEPGENYAAAGGRSIALRRSDPGR
jgi:hypothetical protein